MMSNNPVTSALDAAAGQQVLGGKVFNGLAESAVGYTVRAAWESDLRVSEDAWLDTHFGEDPNAKKKNGEWKYRKYLPNPYTSAKSVVGQAIALGIDVKDKGKSELQKEVTSHKDKPQRTSRNDAFDSAVNIVKARRKGHIDDTDLRAIIDYLEAEINS